MIYPDFAALAGRALIALIFLLSGIDKFVHYAPTLGYMQKAGLPFPELLLIASAIIETVAALAILAGWKTRWAAAALFLWMIPVTWVFHNPAVPLDDSRHLGVSQPRGRPGTDGSLHEERRHLGRAPHALRLRPRRDKRQPIQLGGAGCGRTRRMKTYLVLFLLALPCGTALSQAYPTRPVRMMVGFPPGGGTDVVARIISRRTSGSRW